MPDYIANQTDNETVCSSKVCEEGPHRAPQSRVIIATEPLEDGNNYLRGNPVLYAGVLWIGAMRRFLIPRTCGTYSHTCVPALDLPTEVSAHWSDEADSLVLQVADTSIPAQKPVESIIHEVTDTSTPALADSFEILLPQPTTQLVPAELEDDVTKVQSGWETKTNYQIKSPLQHAVSKIEEISVNITERVHFFSGRLKDLVIGSQTTSEIKKRMQEFETDAFKWFSIGTCSVVGYAMGRYRSRLTRYVYGGTGGVAMATICFPDHAHRYNRQGVEFCQWSVLYGMDLWRNGPQNPIHDGDSGAPDFPNTKGSKVTDLSTKTYHDFESLKNNYFKEPLYNPKLDDEINNVESIEHRYGREIHNSEAHEDLQYRPRDSSSENSKDRPFKYDQETPRLHLFPDFVPYCPAIPSPPKNLCDSDDETINNQKLQFREEYEPDIPHTASPYDDEGHQYTNNSPNINIDLCIQSRVEEYYTSCKNEEKEQLFHNNSNNNESQEEVYLADED